MRVSFSSLGMAKLGTAELDTMLLLLLVEGADVVLLLLLPRIAAPVKSKNDKLVILLQRKGKTIS